MINDLYQNISTLIKEYSINIISARDKYKSNKGLAFYNILIKNALLYPHLNKIIVIGDSMEEYNGIQNCKQFMITLNNLINHILSLFFIYSFVVLSLF